MDHDHRTADTGMLGSETENPARRDSRRTIPEPAATTRERAVATTDMSDADADGISLSADRTSNPQR
jgi:hypothetical protein